MTTRKLDVEINSCPDRFARCHVLISRRVTFVMTAVFVALFSLFVARKLHLQITVLPSDDFSRIRAQFVARCNLAAIFVNCSKCHN